MPVVVDYAPVNSILTDAGNVGANANTREAAQLSNQQQQLQMAQAAQAAQQQDAAQRLAMQGQAQAFAESQAREPVAQGLAQGGAQGLGQPAYVGYVDPDGNTLKVTPQQKVALTNLDNSGIQDPAQRKAMQAQIIGQPNLVAVQQPDGTTSYMPPQAASLAGYRNEQLGLGQQRVGIAQDRADAASQAADWRRNYQERRLGQIDSALDARVTQAAGAAQAKTYAAQRSAVDAVAEDASKEAERAEQAYHDTFASLPKTLDLNAAPSPDETQDVTRARARALAAKARASQAAAAALAAEQAREVVRAQQAQSITGAQTGGQAATPNPAAPAPAAAQPALPPGAVMNPDGTMTYNGTVYRRPQGG